MAGAAIEAEAEAEAESVAVAVAVAEAHSHSHPDSTQFACQTAYKISEHTQLHTDSGRRPKNIQKTVVKKLHQISKLQLKSV